MKHSFGSDNHSGIHPKIMDAIIDSNSGYEPAYGDDPYTDKAISIIQNKFGRNCEVYLTLNGTGANCTALKHLTNSYNSVICSDLSHINVDECGAPELIAGCKLLPIPSKNGKIAVEDIAIKLETLGNQHNSQPKVVSISQPTELGTLYTDNEIINISNLIHSFNGYLHIDGARIANVAAAKDKDLRAITKDLGADIISFGGTKNGMLMGEAVIVFNNRIPNNDSFKYYRKQSGQLFSKMRYISAQFIAYLEDNLYLELANNANKMAKYMETELNNIPNVKICESVDTNAIFAIIPKAVIKKMLTKYLFYVWDNERNMVRWMCSFSTTKEDIDEFIKDLKINIENGNY